MLDVTLLPILEDNYCYILRDGDVSDVVVVDPGEADPVIAYCEEHGLKPEIILNTHHHWDHANGDQALRDKYGAKLIAPAKDQHRIPDVDHGVSQGDVVSILGHEMHVTETPGHTSGHVSFYFPDSTLLFSGDTLFAMGCGRLFEGTAEQMFDAFSYYKSLPDETKVYCGHEYTLSNAEFCLSVMSDNAAMKKRMHAIRNARQQGKSTIPSTIGLEKETNIFMLADSVEQFADYRTQKDNF